MLINKYVEFYKEKKNLYTKKIQLKTKNQFKVLKLDNSQAVTTIFDNATRGESAQVSCQ